MSDWCPTHKTYSAKREPNSVCGKCWQIYLYRNPEVKGPEQAERKAKS